MRRRRVEPSEVPWRRRMYEVIFEHQTPAGRAFDVTLLVAIAASVGVVLLETVPAVRARYGRPLLLAEWGFTILFTVEYVLRILCVRRPSTYVFSPLGIVDLLAIVPTYVSLFLGGAQTLAVVRALRLLRVFRVLKLPNYVTEAGHLTAALRAGRRKITIFVFTVLTIVLIVGSLMYLIEGPAHGFTSIPESVYWAIVTLTTVGYGDIAPQTALGRFVASALMITGYGIIAVPTGIVTAEMVTARRRDEEATSCPACGRAGHEGDARFCRHCGGALGPRPGEGVKPGPG